MPHRKHIAQDKFVTGKALDIGYAEFPNHTSKNLYGIDIVDRPTVPLPQYVETKKVDLNVQPIPYPDGFFDTVIAGDVIEHVTNPLFMLCEANRVLKPGGTLIVSTPNPYYYWEAMQNLLVRYEWMRAKQEGHFTTFTRINMRNILTRTGFELVTELGNFFTLIVLKWTFHLVRLPFLTYQITYIAKKVGAPEHYVLSKPAGQALQKIATQLGHAG
ncbi:MAG: class I SAM-dependent methyltransferase [Candidatus Peribacteraceae bacterium]